MICPMDKNMEIHSMNEKIPMPPTRSDLFLPIVFWSTLMLHLDKKIESIIKNYGFGEVRMNVKIHKNRIYEVSFNDEIKIRDLVEKAGNAGDPNAPQTSLMGNNPIDKRKAL